MPTRVIIHSDQPTPLADLLRARFPDAVLKECNSYAGMHELVPEFQPDIVYSVCFEGRNGFPTAALMGEGGPRWISVGGSGCDHLGKWDASRVTVTNSAGVAGAMMAEYVLGGYLHFNIDVEGLTADKSAHHWQHGRTVRPLNGQTLLIVGLGQTGQAIAARAKAFGMTVLGTRARPVPMENVDEVHGSDDLADLWPRADYIAIATPLLPSTKGLVDASSFELMKPGVVIADVSRGGVVDHSALLEALQSGRVRGAFCDVFETEPLPADSPLWDAPNLIISPHCSSVYDGWEVNSFRMFLDNMARWEAGETLNNIVDPKRGY